MMFTIIVILLFLCFLGWLCQFGKFGAGAALVILLLVVHAWMCTNVTWYGEQVVAPRIVIKIDDGLFSSRSEPLLGEEIYECGDDADTYCVTITDHKIYADQYDNSPDIKIKIEPKNATFAKAKTTLTIKKVAVSQNKNTPSWLSAEDFKDQVTTLDDKFEYTIYGDKLRMNENSDVEPTKYVITAKNKAGTDTKTLIVTRYPLYHACALYSENHPGKSSTEDVGLCKERAEYNEKHKPSTTTTTTTTTTSKPSSSSSSNKPSSSTTGSVCYHYESGRCWDDIENEAYSSGMWDKNYGYEGGSYAPPSGCTGVCEDIYEDAYYQGWEW